MMSCHTQNVLFCAVLVRSFFFFSFFENKSISAAMTLHFNGTHTHKWIQHAVPFRMNHTSWETAVVALLFLLFDFPVFFRTESERGKKQYFFHSVRPTGDTCTTQTHTLVAYWIRFPCCYCMLLFGGCGASQTIVCVFVFVLVAWIVGLRLTHS